MESYQTIHHSNIGVWFKISNKIRHVYLVSNPVLQVLWAKVNEFGPLYGTKVVELRLVTPYFGLAFKLKLNPKLDLVSIRLGNSTSSSLGLNFNINIGKARIHKEPNCR